MLRRSAASACRTSPGLATLTVSLCLATACPAAELVLWTTDKAPERLVTMEYVANLFMALNDGTEIRIEGIDENEIAARLATAAAQRALPALVNTGSELMLAFGADGLLDEDAAAQIVAQVGRPRFYDATLDMLASGDDGRPGAVPFHGWIQGLWYRKDWFDEAGLASPADWDSLLKAAQTLHDPAARRYGILIGTEADAYAGQVFAQLALSNGAALFDETGRPAVASARMIETLAFYRELARYTPPAPVTPRSRDFFLQGRVAMMFYSTFIMDDLAIASVATDSLTGKHFPDLDGASFDIGLVDKVRMVPVLTRRQPISYGSINAIGVVAGLDEFTRALALDFLGFLFRPDIYITWLHMAPGGMMPVLRDIAQSDDFFRDPSGVFQRYGRARIVAIIAGLEKLSSFGRSGDRFNPHASRALAEGIVARMVHRTVTGEAPRQAAAQAEVEMRELMRDR